MPRITLVQKLRNLSDSGAQEALHGPVFMCRFVGIDIGREPVPDEAAILKFRHLLHERHLSRDLFRETHRQLESRGVRASQAPTGGAIINTLGDKTQEPVATELSEKTPVGARNEASCLAVLAESPFGVRRLWKWDGSSGEPQETFVKAIGH